MQTPSRLRIIQRSAAQPAGKKLVKEIEMPQRFLPLGDSHVRDILNCGQYPVNQCVVKSVHRNKHIFAATLEGIDAEVFFRVDPAYAMFLTDKDRLRGIVLTYRKELKKIDYHSATAQAIQVAFDPLLYVECLPLNMF